MHDEEHSEREELLEKNTRKKKDPYMDIVDDAENFSYHDDLK